MEVVVVGAGVSGLVSAWALTEAGHRVSILAEARGLKTTSSVAGAIWLPYLCEPRDRVLTWAAITYEWLERLSRTSPAAGVDMLTLDEAGEAPWWLDAVPEPATHVEIGGFGSPAWRVRVPRVDPPIFLQWMEGELASKGVTIRRGRVSSLEDVEGDIVVNSTGLGARRLCNDAELEARFGQVVLARAGTWPLSQAASDERDEVTYVIPRREAVVLGGVSEAYDADSPANVRDDVTASILERARRAGVGHAEVVDVRAALRPYRSSVRVEREGRIIHNYGHGGAGWTLCWGCAQEVVKLAMAI